MLVRMTGPDVSREIAALEDLVSECAGWAAGGDSPPARPSPGVSAWSALQHVDHAARATQSALSQVGRILAGDDACLPPGPLSPAAEAILRSESIPRGVAEAPRPTRPDPAPAPADVARRLGDLRAALRSADARAAEVAAAVGRLPHFALGPMTAAEWIRFARVHVEHHVRIAREASPPRGAA